MEATFGERGIAAGKQPTPTEKTAALGCKVLGDFLVVVSSLAPPEKAWSHPMQKKEIAARLGTSEKTLMKYVKKGVYELEDVGLQQAFRIRLDGLAPRYDRACAPPK